VVLNESLLRFSLGFVSRNSNPSSQLNVEPDEKSWHVLKKLASMVTFASISQ
jgi:hypothetical protein